MSFPRPLRRSVSLSPARTLRLVVLGQSAVGKTGTGAGRRSKGATPRKLLPSMGKEEAMPPISPALVYAIKPSTNKLGKKVASGGEGGRTVSLY
uniref:Uncharacterized protein n=1 Tax=Sphaerodactylus townsendi TaxID=933632 RepID=A0ACB8G412_9SAUR